MDENIAVVLTTCPDQFTARKISEKLVKCGLVRCAQIGGVSESLYIWKKKFYAEREVKVVFKTSTRKLDAAKKAYFSEHPYECPEWVELTARASKAYAEWINLDEKEEA